ncbi:hypothetical protein HQ576_04375, partial [bacterium]|nr:hypothetical protein [bacterium]
MRCRWMSFRLFPFFLCALIGVLSVSKSKAAAGEPVRLIFDTDMGNDIDD